MAAAGLVKNILNAWRAKKTSTVAAGRAAPGRGILPAYRERQRHLRDLGWRALPRTAPGHLYDAGPVEALQPQTGIGAARAGIRRGDGSRVRRRVVPARGAGAHLEGGAAL